MTQRVLGPGGSPRRRRVAGTFTVLVIAAIAAGLLFVVGASANLAPSTFEGNDGNLVPNTGTDWSSPAPNRAIGNDLASGTTDNSFGQGDKEDDPTVHVGDGSIPNSKADLAQFYVGSEQLSSNNHVYLYLGWTRANDGGTTNFDFEINQKAQPDLTTNGTKTLVRTSGDLLVNYLFQGTGTPQVAIRVWNGSAWGNPIDASAFSEAAINSSAVANPLPGAIQNPTPALRFGETAIDLTAGNIIPPGVCEAFGSAFVKTRASTSFTSEVKDFIAPIAVNINTCATIIVKKVTVPSPDPTDTSFDFTSNFDGNFSLKNGGEQKKEGLNPGTYSVSETAPTNWVLTSFTCDDGSLPSAIGLGPGETVTCTATNTLQLGAIKVSKSSIKGNTALQGGKFSVTGPNNFSTTLTTGIDGTACVDKLAFGSYTVTETEAPGGYAIDDSAGKSVTVGTNETCATTSVRANTAFTDTPLTDIKVTVNSQDDGPGGTMSTINCVRDNTAPTPDDTIGTAASAHDPQVEVKNLKPATYVCTVVVDP